MIDNYFSTGNVYVIDDQISEAKPIINSLYRHQVPHIYFDGSPRSLPEVAKQVRMIFLDLNLKPSLGPDDIKSFKSMHASILNKLLANKSSSYLILVWSKQENAYLDEFKSIFNAPDDFYDLNNKKPLEIISLDKNNFFNLLEDNSYEWKAEKEDELLQLIEDRLTTNEAFKILSAWETLISKSGSKTVDYLFDLVKGDSQVNMNTKLNSIITSLSISYQGFENFSLSNDQKKTDAFMLALSELIDDEIDKEIIINTQPEFKKWSKNRLTSIDKARLNSKLLTSIEVSDKFLPGSIYKSKIKDHDYRKMLFDLIDFERKASKKKLTQAERTKGSNLNREEKVKVKEGILDLVLHDLEKVIPVELNLTPLCDVVQNKEEYYRLVPGFLLSSKTSDFLFKNTDRNYFSPFMFSEKDLKECILILDFRYLHSISKEQLEAKRKLCTLRKSFVDEIQSKLANHVSRLGILYLS